MNIDQLTAREKQIFFGIADGERLVEISKRLFLSIKTVSTYRTRVLEKLNLESNKDIVTLARSIAAGGKSAAEVQRDHAWQELRDIREAIKADSDESTLDEVKRLVAQRDRCTADLQSQSLDKAA